MWILFGGFAMVFAALNIACWAKGKDAPVFRFASLAFTALTLCAFYGMNAFWVAAEDWSALMDVVPAMAKTLWACTVLSIAINSISLMKRKGE